ncbi:hypothetical protein A3D05_04590 [Candidatus Gottesmanbacteria bacterium RIFCSPHIGHO2_02_FULL_40_24]|uniref:Uncharacterized protein n=1 Tax=Candidatus Gottesmanbacteria bacterium RIFCSPHIGHO2_01_FULL_40_15 TaxID=1798376 RepID=A0A1F5Z1T6_9BACT|nr:MAG: hypothetical protein A2777_05620 [Candidatus Gottesmanbacteria bacterium RIFCSPHIGHO2_01_FULL_40_15]OGG16148.1 MAG: hypothetical protein A3D05_04590 [Candidatus Gottesmanbacteria bacterium RIFCSPHIGHO2_02_FULL_40_24]OGG21466.1 MAG: hypothetical protein A3B48_04565 [Candidatus Gottesmanbacteria bacterium RIFCSPLOWO2_01_FULL_40_10]OGG25818.1 MAG: hypothetical protein A3E42_05860 [Candidatus Gottesmanbacteria bacterium RIFCSPHIGHO2_12_FULL_40_13]
MKNISRRKIILTAVIFLILLLDWAALDDITTGNEPDYYGEYAVLILSAVFFVIYFLWKSTRKKAV